MTIGFITQFVQDLGRFSYLAQFSFDGAAQVLPQSGLEGQ